MKTSMGTTAREEWECEKKDRPSQGTRVKTVPSTAVVT